MEEAPIHGVYGVAVGEFCSFHCGGLAPDAILLRVEEEGGGPDEKEGLGKSVVRDEPVRIMKLKILEKDLECLPVLFFLCVLARPQAEEEGDLDGVGLVLGEGAGDVSRLHRGHV